MSELGRRLKMLRRERNLKQSDVTAAAHFFPGAYSAWETGARAPDFGHTVDLARYYNVSLDYLAGLTDDRSGDYQAFLSALADASQMDPSAAILGTVTRLLQICASASDSQCLAIWLAVSSGIADTAAAAAAGNIAGTLDCANRTAAAALEIQNIPRRCVTDNPQK